MRKPDASAPSHAVNSPRRSHTIANVKQKPISAGPRKPAIQFDGESVYNYRQHALSMLKESLALMVLPCGCFFAYLGSFFPALPAVPLAVKVLYLFTLGMLSRVVARGPRNSLRRDLTGRHVVITGGTSGIGQATAAQLARMGADITLISPRNPDDVEPALRFIRAHGRSPAASSSPADAHGMGAGFRPSRQRIEFHSLDLADFVAVRDFCHRLRQQNRTIDILINNAAIMHPKAATTRLGVETQLAVNYLGPFLLTEGLLPLIEAVQGRIVYVSCSSHISVKERTFSTFLKGQKVGRQSAGDHFDGLKQYGFTKLGCIYHAQDLAARACQRASKSTAAGDQVPARAKFRGVVAASGYLYPLGKVFRCDGGGGDRVPRYTTCACAPGGAITNLYRFHPMSVPFRLLYYPFLAFMRTAWDGSQTVVNCAVREELHNGGYYASTRYHPSGLSEAACSSSMREQMMAWTRNTMQSYMNRNYVKGE
ncbi:unnamed protein product [Phytomonas sp. EM1]|nr:unnamed protein product [Phytomonas sp. EM1]|eukprot:CCW62615.1 unnamed protein product [Phytomonas sp. isolate EM1]